MAVGDNRHYRIDTITPRHFLQSGQQAGVDEEIVHSIFGELRETGQEAIARTLDRLPARFSKEVSASIQAGLLRRLELIERIGIGGAVAYSPLPHHRTYGARIRRFRDLSPQGPEVRDAFRRGGFAAPSFLSGFTQSVPG
jgi:hypothetical protein